VCLIFKESFVLSNFVGLDGDFQSWHEQFHQARLKGLKRSKRKSVAHEN